VNQAQLYTPTAFISGSSGRISAQIHKLEDSPITVLAVGEGASLKQFLQVPYRVYRDDPAWVAPLLLEQRMRFAPGNDFFKHARWRAWVAFLDGVPVGRITAQIDDLHQQRYGDHMGYFGMIEAIDDEAVFAGLFGAAQSWLLGEGLQRVRGPFNLHVNEEVGLLVDGFGDPPFFLMPHGRPYYAPQLEKLGYSGVKDVFAYKVRPDFEAPRVMLKLAQRVSGRVTVRSLNRKAVAEEAELMRELFNDAWQNNWGFVPLTREEFADTVKTLTMVMPDDYIQIALYDGEPVAFIVALPNINEAVRGLNGKLLPFGWLRLLWRLKIKHPKTARVPLMGVRQEFQQSRLGPTLAFMVIDAVRKALHKRGVREVEMGWILEDNAGMRNIIETIGGVAYKRYRFYEKDL
jgi:hypothetical protein